MKHVIDADEANYDIGMMYLNAGKWKNAFPFLLKAADRKYEPAIKEIIQHYNGQYKDKDNDVTLFLEEQTELFERPTTRAISAYYLGLFSTNHSTMHDAFEKSELGGFVLGAYRLALLMYHNKDYKTAQYYYRTVTRSNQWKFLPDYIKAYVYNDLSLCGWFQNRADMFIKYNQMAQDLDFPLAVSNMANAYFQGTVVCKAPQYSKASELYEQALKLYYKQGKTHESNEIQFVKQQIQKCN